MSTVLSYNECDHNLFRDIIKMPNAQRLATRVDQLNKRIARACEAAERNPDCVTLLAVTKTRSPAEVELAYAAGLRRFAENYLDEAATKQDKLRHARPEWHFIGPIQSNKTRALADRFDWVQSVDRKKIIRRLGEQRRGEKPPLNVLLQVNIDREPQKAGCEPEAVKQLAAQVAAVPSLKLRGLMAIPSVGNAAANAHGAFARMHDLFRSLRIEYADMDTLSMGMSGDLEEAIAEGATMVRIGTALFGPRRDAG